MKGRLKEPKMPESTSSSQLSVFDVPPDLLFSFSGKIEIYFPIVQIDNCSLVVCEIADDKVLLFTEMTLLGRRAGG